MSIYDNLSEESKKLLSLSNKGGINSVDTPTNSLGEPVTSEIAQPTSALGEYVKRLQGDSVEQVPNTPADEAGLISGVLSGAAGVIKPQVDLFEYGLGKNAVTDYIGKNAQEIINNNQRKRFNDGPELSMDYLTDPNGARYTVGSAIGSSVALGVELAAAAKLGGALGLKAAGTAIATRMPWLGELAATKLGKLAIANVAETPFEAASEAGGVIEELQKEGKSEAEINEAISKSFAGNMALLGVSNFVQSYGATRFLGLLKKYKAGDKTAKGILGDVMKGAAGGGVTNAGEEFGQSMVEDWAKGQNIDYGKARQQGAEGFVSGSVIGGVGSGIGSAAQKYSKPSNPELNSKDNATDQDVQAEKEEYWGDAQRPEEFLESQAENKDVSSATKTAINSVLKGNNKEQIYSMAERMGWKDGRIAAERDAFVSSIAEQESGGNYDLINPDSGAIGKYQIMPENWSAWAQDAGLPADAAPTPENQEIVAQNKLAEYYDKYGARGAAIAWYAGEGAVNWSENALNAKQGDYPSINEYADSVVDRMGNNFQGFVQGKKGITRSTPYTPNTDAVTEQILNDVLNGDTSAATAYDAMNPEAQMFNEALQSSDRFNGQEQGQGESRDYVAELADLDKQIADYENALSTLPQDGTVDMYFADYYNNQLARLREQRANVAPLARGQKGSAPAWSGISNQRKYSPLKQEARETAKPLDVEAQFKSDFSDLTDQQLFDFVRRRPNDVTAKAAEAEMRKRGLAKSNRNVGEIVPVNNAVAKAANITTTQDTNEEKYAGTNAYDGIVNANDNLANNSNSIVNVREPSEMQLPGMEALPAHQEKYAGSNRIQNLISNVRERRAENGRLIGTEDEQTIVRTPSGDRFTDVQAARMTIDNRRGIADAEVVVDAERKALAAGVPKGLVEKIKRNPYQLLQLESKADKGNDNAAKALEKVNPAAVELAHAVDNSAKGNEVVANEIDKTKENNNENTKPEQAEDTERETGQGRKDKTRKVDNTEKRTEDEPSTEQSESPVSNEKNEQEEIVEQPKNSSPKAPQFKWNRGAFDGDPIRVGSITFPDGSKQSVIVRHNASKAGNTFTVVASDGNNNITYMDSNSLEQDVVEGIMKYAEHYGERINNLSEKEYKSRFEVVSPIKVLPNNGGRLSAKTFRNARGENAVIDMGNGKKAFTNASIIAVNFDENKNKSLVTKTSESFKSISKATVDKIISGLESDYQKGDLKQYDLIPAIMPVENYNLVVLKNGNEYRYVQADYVKYFLKECGGDVSFHTKNTLGPFLVMNSKGETVGVVTPIRADNSIAKGLAEFEKLKCPIMQDTVDLRNTQNKNAQDYFYGYNPSAKDSSALKKGSQRFDVEKTPYWFTVKQFVEYGVRNGFDVRGAENIKEANDNNTEGFNVGKAGVEYFKYLRENNINPANPLTNEEVTAPNKEKERPSLVQVKEPVAKEKAARKETVEPTEKTAQNEAGNEQNADEYKYYMNQRGASPGAVPKGFIRVDENDKGGRYGAIYYAKPLSKAEIGSYELTPDANNKKQESIQDFGAYVSGARKETDGPKGTFYANNSEQKSEKKEPKKDVPEWEKPFSVRNDPLAGGTDTPFFVSYKGREGSRIPIVYRRLSMQPFATEQDAKNAIKAAVFLNNFRTPMHTKADGTQEYVIEKKIGDHKYWTIKEGFTSKEELDKYVVKNIDEILATKTYYGESDLATPIIKNWREARRGDSEDRLKGRNATAEMFMEEFGFRGVQFGNWNNQQERQELMNATYEAMHDLADVLGLPPKIVSLNGELALAFGARGSGLSGARAHFEPKATIINLTKMKGAGALAHEWQHAVDQYLLIKGGLIKSERNGGGWLIDPNSVLHASNLGYDFRRAKLPDGLKEAFTKLMNVMMYKDENFTKDVNLIDKRIDNNKDYLDKVLNKLREYVAKDRKYGSKKSAATPEQLAKFDEAAQKVAQFKGQLEYDFSLERHTCAEIENLGKIVKEITNRGFTKNNSTVNDIVYYVRMLEKLNKEKADAEAQSVGVKQVPTDYKAANVHIDKGRATDYWTKPTEMLSRAFSSYVEDELKAQGYTSDFLSYGSDNALYMFGKPFPEGKEREAINKAIKEFYKEVAKEVERNVKETGEIKFSLAAEPQAYNVVEKTQNMRTYGEVLDEVLDAFPNAKVTSSKGNIVAELQNGAKIAISIKDNIILNEKQQKKAMKAHGTNVGVVEGYWKKFTQDGCERMVAVSQKSRIGTAYHEALHAAIDLALTEKERNSLYNYYDKLSKAQGRDVEETLADAYRDWVLARKNGNGTIFGKLWRKVKDLCTKVKALFDEGAKVQTIFQDIESGSVYERGTDGNGLQDRIKAMPVNVNIDLSQRYVPIDLGQLTDKIGDVSNTDAGRAAVISYIKKNLTGKNFNVNSADLRLLYGFDNVDKYNRIHVASAKSGKEAIKKPNGVKNLDNRIARNITLSNMEDVLENSVLVEIGEPKTHNGHFANPKHDKHVSKAFKAVMPITLPNGQDRVLVITAQSRQGVIKPEGMHVSIYEISTKKTKSTAVPLIGKTSGTSVDYSLAELLWNVKDLNGVPYVDIKTGDLNIEQDPQKRYFDDEDIKASVATADGISFNEDTSMLGVKEAGGIKPWFKQQWKKLYADWIDKNDALHDLDMAFSMGLNRQLTDGEKIYNRVQTLPASASGMAQALIEGTDSHIHALNEKLGLKGEKALSLVTINKVLKTIDHTKMDKIAPKFLEEQGKKNWVDAFSQYLGYERLLEMKKVSEAEGKEYKLPVDERKIKAYIAAAPAEFKKAASQYYLVNDNMLKLMENAGLISAETRKLLTTKYKKYCPLMRDFSDTAAADSFIQGLTRGGKGIGNVSSMLKKISLDGSDRTILSPLESTVKAVAVCANRCERNRVAQMAVNMAKQSKGALDEVIKPVPDGKSDPKNCIFTVMFDGKKEAFQTTQDLYGPIVGYNLPSAGMVLGLAKSCATMLRTGATTSGSFVLRNVLRDTVFAGISSQHGFVPLLDTFRGAYALWKNPKVRAEFEAGGVTGFNMYNNKASNYDDLVKMNGKPIDWHKPSAIWDGLKMLGGKAEDVSAFWESATRMGEFLKAREQGKTIDEAVRSARELTLDFSRSGVVGQNVNQYIPFFNAALQGGDKMARLLHDDFVGTSTKLAEYIVLPSLILWAFNHNEDWWKELEPGIKYSHWCLPGGIRIPMPQEAGVLFGGGLVAALDRAFNKDKQAMGYFANELKSVAAPNLIPTVFLPLIEWQTNYSFFKDGPLVAKRLQSMPNEMQYTNHTSTLSKGLGKVTGLSPVKIDNTVRGYTGTMGMFLWQTGDVLEDKNEPDKKVSERQFIRDFNVNAQHRMRYENEFYELRDAANKRHAGYGTKGKPSADVIAIRKYGTIISGLNKDIQKITDSKTLSPQRKRELIDNRKARIKAVAKKAVEKYGDKYL